MNLKDQKLAVRPAAIYSPQRIEDEASRRLIEAEMGIEPIWVITASQKTFQDVLRPATEAALAMRLARTNFGSRHVALVLQFGNLQLRSLAGLDNPLVRDALEYIRTTGHIRVAFGNPDELVGDIVRCPVPLADIELVLAEAALPATVAPDYRILGVALAAADSREPKVLPSLLRGTPVRSVEVSVVLNGELMTDDRHGPADEHLDDPTFDAFEQQGPVRLH